MLHTVKKVEYINEYKLKLQFDDKRVKIVNLEGMLKKAKNMLLPLVDINYFKQVECDGITIYWPNGVDLCPDALYKMGEDIARTPRRPKTNSRLGIKTPKRRKLKHA